MKQKILVRYISGKSGRRSRCIVNLEVRDIECYHEVLLPASGWMHYRFRGTVTWRGQDIRVDAAYSLPPGQPIPEAKEWQNPNGNVRS